MSRGRLITLEGGEGGGKSTQAAHVVAWLQARGRSVLRTREPGGTPLAEAIRTLVLEDWREGVPPAAELLLMFAARAAHLENAIRPALAAGTDVVCDRFIDASWAYQGAGRGIAGQHLQALQELVLQDQRPDLTLLLDLEPRIGLARARGRGEVNRFEDEALGFAERIRDAYRARAQAEPARFVLIDAAAPENAVRAAIEATLSERLA